MAVLVHPGGDLASSPASLWTSADESLAAAAHAARALEGSGSDASSFWVGAEEGLVSLEVDGVSHDFVHCWTVVRSEIGTACGGSGPIEIPERLTEGVDPAHPERIPTTRRHGGMVGSLMGGLESRRDAFETATVHALASLFFGLVEPRPGPWRSGV